MLAGVFKTPWRWRAVALIVTAVTVTILEVVLVLQLASWNAEFFNLLDQRAVGGLPAQALSFLAIILGIMALPGSKP